MTPHARKAIERHLKLVDSDIETQTRQMQGGTYRAQEAAESLASLRRERADLVQALEGESDQQYPVEQFYIGLKRITAWREDREDGPGYGVRYADGYESWSPLYAFEEAYQPVDAMSFSAALHALKAGHRVARAGWNGKGMWLVLVPGSTGVDWDTNPRVDMMTAQGTMQPGWLASQTDLLADDWMIVDEPQQLPSQDVTTPPDDECSEWRMARELTIPTGQKVGRGPTKIRFLSPHVEVFVGLSKDVTARLIVDRDDALKVGLIEEAE